MHSIASVSAVCGAAFLALGLYRLWSVRAAVVRRRRGRLKLPAAGLSIRRRQLVFAGVYLLLGAFLLYGARPRIVVARAPRSVPLAEGLAGEVARIVGAEARRIGLVVGIVRPGEQQVLSFGTLSLADSRPPGGETVFPIGSITKTFTGILLADMAARGEVGLDDPVALYLPDGAVPEGWEGSGITLLDLATHTSGLPRMPPYMGPTPGKLLTWRLLRNRYVGHSRRELFERLGGIALAAPPGVSFAYSNLGVGLLGHALEGAAGLGYDGLVRRRIAEPLGMSSTRMEPAPDLPARLATGFYDAWRLGPIGVELPAAPWEYPVLQGAGALLSTGDDLLRFLEANVEPPTTPLGDAIRRSHLRCRDRDGEGGGIGLGWHLSPWPEEGDELVWHSGATSAYTSFLGFLPDSRVGVALLNNTPEPVDDLGWEILRLLARGSGSRSTPPSSSVSGCATCRPSGSLSIFGRGTAEDRQLHGPHDARWLPAGYPGVGRLLIFNNGAGRLHGRYSSVIEIEPPVEADGSYRRPGARGFGPERPAWEYTATPPRSFFAEFISGAERLSDGNTLICSGPQGRFLAVSPAGEIVWEYRNPYSGNAPNPAGDPPYSVFRAQYVAREHPALADRRLTPLDPQPPRGR